jgi:hypothetical protein
VWLPLCPAPPPLTPAPTPHYTYVLLLASPLASIEHIVDEVHLQCVVVNRLPTLPMHWYIAYPPVYGPTIATSCAPALELSLLQLKAELTAVT